MTRRLFVAVLLLTPSFDAMAAGFDAALATNAVGIDLYRELATANPSANLIISPYSIESALALAYAGADGETRTEMARALRLPRDDASLQAGFAELRNALHDFAERSKRFPARVGSDDDRPNPIQWSEANRLYAQSGYDFRPEFVAVMKDGFATPFSPLDFKGDPKGTRHAINTWVEDQTSGKIQGLVPEGGLSATTRLVLVNALYLRAQWDRVFDPKETRSELFHSTHGNRDVPMMRQTAFLGYAAEDGLTVVALDYLWGELQFLVLLPDKGQTLETAAAKLTPQRFARWAKLGNRNTEQNVTIILPKFRAAGTTLSLGDALRALGVKQAFDVPKGSANFDRIAPREKNDYLAVTEVFHQTFVALDEQGTEASAATLMMMATFGIAPEPKKPIEVRVDRPFLFAIQHRASGVCLFLGRILDPH